MNITRREFCQAALLAGVAPSAVVSSGAFSTRARAAQNAAQAAGDGRMVLLTLLHTNDPHGRVYLPGKPQGLAKLATLIRPIRAAMPNTLLLDAGDLIHGTPQEKTFEGRPMIAAMNALGYDAATAGNHEFDFGQRITRQAFGMARFPMLSANVLDTQSGAPWGGLKPYIMRELQGVRVAIFGLTTPGTVGIQWPRTLQGIRFASPIDTARALVPRLRREERADVVVFLSHLGFEPDRELAEAVPDIDIILGGHSHTRLEKQVWIGRTLIMQTGAHGQALGRADLLVRRDAAGPDRVTINGRDGQWWGHGGVKMPPATPPGQNYPASPLIDPTQNTPEDPAVLAAYRPYDEAQRRRHAEVLTRAEEPLPAAGAKERETALGDLMADAVRAKTKADVAVIPSGMIARGLPAGDVRFEDAYETIGGYTRQHLVVARAPGAQLRRMAAATLAPGRIEMQVSGLSLAGAELRVAGQPLRDDALYTVAGAAYIIQSHLLGQPGVTILSDDPEAPTTRDALIGHLRGHAPLVNRPDGRLAPAAPATPVALLGSARPPFISAGSPLAAACNG